MDPAYYEKKGNLSGHIDLLYELLSNLRRLRTITEHEKNKFVIQALLREVDWENFMMRKELRHFREYEEWRSLMREAVAMLGR